MKQDTRDTLTVGSSAAAGGATLGAAGAVGGGYASFRRMARGSGEAGRNYRDAVRTAQKWDNAGLQNVLHGHGDPVEIIWRHGQAKKAVKMLRNRAIKPGAAVGGAAGFGIGAGIGGAAGLAAIARRRKEKVSKMRDADKSMNQLESDWYKARRRGKNSMAIGAGGAFVAGAELARRGVRVSKPYLTDTEDLFAMLGGDRSTAGNTGKYVDITERNHNKVGTQTDWFSRKLKDGTRRSYGTFNSLRPSTKAVAAGGAAALGAGSLAAAGFYARKKNIEGKQAARRRQWRSRQKFYAMANANKVHKSANVKLQRAKAARNWLAGTENPPSQRGAYAFFRQGAADNGRQAARGFARSSSLGRQADRWAEAKPPLPGLRGLYDDMYIKHLSDSARAGERAEEALQDGRRLRRMSRGALNNSTRRVVDIR